MDLLFRISDNAGYSQTQSQISGRSSPILNPLMGLSVLELEEVLDRSLAAVQEFYPQKPEYHSAGNYFTHPIFLQICKNVHGSVSEQRYRERPQVLISENYGNNGVMYNPIFDESIYAKLQKFKDHGSDKPGNFSRQFLHNWTWLQENQLDIASYLCEVQRKYILSSSPFDMQEVSQQNIADHLGYSLSSANRLVQNLTLQLPDTRVIFATELITGNRLTQIQGLHALQQLYQEGSLYRKNKVRWNLTAQDVVEKLYERFEFEMQKGSVGESLRKLQEKQGIPLVKYGKRKKHKRQ